MRVIASEYGYTPDQIADMTPRQISLLLKPDDRPVAGVRKFKSVAEAREFQKMMKGGR